MKFPAHQVFFFVCLTFALQQASGVNDDEDSPYEFGFTIDGQQHRHEKKDVNGIIQGEFGFITADGIYHVTVYATDENGNFKILSMKNVRVSPPLDGSGTPEQKQQQLQPYKAAPSSQAPPPSPTTTQPPQPSPTAPAAISKFSGFTTQPTVKPACASCGYVTTSATPKKFEFQNAALNERTGAVNPSISSPGAVSPVQSSGPAAANYQQQQPQQNPVSINVPLTPENQPPQSSPVQNIGGSFQGGIPVPPQYASEQNKNPAEFSQNQPPQYSQNQVDYPANPTEETPSARLSQVSVNDGVIHVPGNPDIPIQDKYPNMQDGLPAGIEENDITDLLYKFNYTVGFHGHYEKGYKNGAKVGGYFVNGRDGISRVVTYVADENGYQPKVKLINLGLESEDTPKEGTEKNFGLKNFEFVWYPIK